MLLFRNRRSTLATDATFVVFLALSFLATPHLAGAQSSDKSTQPQASTAASVGIGGSATLSTSTPSKAESSATAGANASAEQAADKEKKAGSKEVDRVGDKNKKGDLAEGEKPFDKAEWQRRYRKYNSWYGSTGGILLVDPTSGAPGSVRLQLLIDDFSDTDFLYKKDSVDQVGQTLSLGWTATELVELYGSLRYVGTVSKRPNPDTESDIKTLKEDKHVMGDVRVGIKGGAEATPVLALGGDLGVLLPNQAGGAGPVINSLSAQLRFSLTTDLRKLESKIPLLFRFNLSYLFDNSSAVVKNIEDARYDNLIDPLPRKYERRQFATRFERFALSINREDQLIWALGIEAPLEVATNWYLHPMVEWQWGVPVNRHDFVCPDFWEFDKASGVTFTDDRCQYNRRAKVYPMMLAAGLRAISPIRGLSALLGVDIGLTGTSKFVRELMPLAPYRVLIGVGYDYDARPPEVRVVEKMTKPVEGPKGRIKGIVLQQGTNAPLPGAGVSFIGRDLSPIQTNQEGKFVSYPFSPGMIEMEVSHPDFQRGGCSTTIGEKGGDSEVTCYILPLPSAGQATGSVVDQWGASIAGARIDLSGPENTSATSDANGQFQKQLAAGEYRVSIDAAGHLIHSSTLTVPPRQTATARFVLVTKPTKSTLEVKDKEIRFKEPLKFAPNSTEISGDSISVIAELTDLLQRSQYIRRIKIWGSTAGNKEEASVSLIRALSVKRRLVDAGIAADRIDAVAGDSPKVKVTIEE